MAHDNHNHDHPGHGHTHGAVDPSIATSERGIWAVKWSFITGADRLRRKAELGGSATLSEQLGKLEREFRAERRRDYFRSPLRTEAATALKTARRAVREATGGAEDRSVGSSK
jgi:hypothetical protein